MGKGGKCMAVKVYFANESEIVREGLKTILSSNPVFVFSNEPNTKNIQKDIEAFHPNIVFVDYQTKNCEICKNLNLSEKSKNKVFFVILSYTYLSDAELHNKCFNGIFKIDVKKEELFKGLSEMFRSGKYIQESLKNLDLNQTNQSDLKKINSLTKRELEVLIQVANGMFNKEIAITLDISERTVKNHLSTIFKKLEVSDRTQAAVFAIRNGIVDI